MDVFSPSPHAATPVLFVTLVSRNEVYVVDQFVSQLRMTTAPDDNFTVCVGVIIRQDLHGALSYSRDCASGQLSMEVRFEPGLYEKFM